MIKNKNCKICHNKLYDKEILSLKNMPKSAQYFPTKDDLINEKGYDLNIYQCQGCGLVQLNTIPVPYYKNVIRASAYSNEMKEFRLKQFYYFVQKYNLKNKKILEIGSGKGEYLSLMRNSGISKVYGIEYLQESVDICIVNNLNVQKDYIESPNYKHKNAPFDSFFILNFLEHIPDINSLLRGIANNLKENAIGLIEVPNFDMILKNNLFSEFISDHLYYFTESTIKKTLEINGFEVLESKVIWHNYILSIVVKKSKQLDLSNFKELQHNLALDLHFFIDKYKNVAIWGAGHQSLALIALTNIQKKIKFVVDSAPFKQGYYTPSTHLRIVSCEELKNTQIDAIIVITASYNEEVVKIIQKDYSNIDIAIVKDNILDII